MSMTPEQRARHLSDLLQASLSAHQRGDLRTAAAGYEEVLDQFPNHAVTLDLFGTLLHQSGEHARALELLERAVAADPNFSQAHNHLGAVRFALGDLAAALDCFVAASETDPNNPEAWLNRAHMLEELGRLDEALTAARRAVDLVPGHAATQTRLGGLLLKSGESEAALGALQLALKADPLALEAYLHFGRAQVALGERAAADNAFRKAMVIGPEAREFYVQYAGGDRSDEAPDSRVLWARRAVCLRPDDPRLWANLASAYARRLYHEKSAGSSRRAMLLDPASEAAHINLAPELYRLRHLPESRRACSWGLSAHPHIAELKIVAGENELVRGNLSRAWELLEGRLDRRLSPARIALPPLWNGRDGDPGRLLVAAEQGIGDEYTFLSFLPRLAEKVEQITVECDARNLPLFRRSFPEMTFIERQLRADEAGRPVFDYSNWSGRHQIDHAIMAGSLPGLFINDPTLAGPSGGYLTVDDNERRFWQERFAELGPRPKVGLCWRSGLSNKLRETRFCSASDLVRSIGADQAEFINLVFDARPEEFLAVERECDCKLYNPQGIDLRDELDRVAALISSLDCVVGMGTAVNLLASAVGTKVIHLGWCYFHCADDIDVVFGDRYTTMKLDEAFDIQTAVARAGALFPEVMKH